MRTAVIVGGGIGGLGAANALLRQGWSVQVLEQAPEFGEVGAGISLWPNAFRALESIGALAALNPERLGAAGGLRDWRGGWLARMDRETEAATHTQSAVVTHRAELLDALLAGIPADSRRAGVRVTGARLAGARAVVEFDGGEIEADLVVGADGIRSAVRGALWPDAPAPRYSGHTGWRVVLPKPASLAAGPEPWAEIWGPGAVFGMFPMSGDRLYCYATAAVPAGGRSPDGELVELRRRYADWCEPIPTVLAAAEPDQVIRNDIYYLPKLTSFVRGPVALLGDAAHAMTPNRGQGGCMALEDAATLGLTIGARPDVATALRRYDELRRPRTHWMWQQSKLSGVIAQLTPAPLRAVRNALIRVLPTSIFVSSLAKPFNWHPTA